MIYETYVRWACGIPQGLGVLMGIWSCTKAVVNGLSWVHYNCCYIYKSRVHHSLSERKTSILLLSRWGLCRIISQMIFQSSCHDGCDMKLDQVSKVKYFCRQGINSRKEHSEYLDSSSRAASREWRVELTLCNARTDSTMFCLDLRKTSYQHDAWHGLHFLASGMTVTAHLQFRLDAQWSAKCPWIRRDRTIIPH